MKYRVLHTIAVFFVSVFFLVPPAVLAQGAIVSIPDHNTVLVSQVRGQECCDPGGLTELENQIATANELGIPLTLTIRYDALQDAEFVSVLRRAAAAGHELGAFLEITPALASASGVTYRGAPHNWYEAHHVYTVGYEPPERQALLDTYMAAFQQQFGRYPRTTNAWILDTWSLRYLREEYGIVVHEITREQWGVDSYTHSGLPPHIPYVPSENWAAIPSATESSAMPLIIRQTISDPVWNYGDTTSSRTSQPNDYQQKDRGFDYFVHLFEQAHNQPFQPRTFAVIGLENSMPEQSQQEFAKQLEYVARWQEPANNQVLTASAFAEQWREQPYPSVRVHQGNDFQEGKLQRAWWITTPNYRARLRFDHGTLYLTDIRLYDPELMDPYLAQPAQQLAYWVTPFVLDGGRFWHGEGTWFHRPYTDQLTDRKDDTATPVRIELATNVAADSLNTNRLDSTWQVTTGDTVLASFAPEAFDLTDHARPFTQHPALNSVVNNWQWQLNEETLWQLQQERLDAGLTRWTPRVLVTDLSTAREEQYPFLLPEVRERTLDVNKSFVLVTNRYAMAGRNPIRLAFFPRDNYGFPNRITAEPTVTVDGQEIHIDQTQPSGQDGLVFIDLNTPIVQAADVTVAYKDFSVSQRVVFAPNCKQQLRACLSRPHYFWWHARNWFGDKYRQWEEAKTR